MARRPLFWRQLALIGACVFFLCLLASFLSPSEAHPPAQDVTPTPIYLPIVLNNYRPPENVYVVSSSAYTDTVSSLYVVGEVINSTPGNVWLVRVTCTLRNASGDVVRMEYTYTMIDVLAPGQKAPFKIRFYDYPDYASYDLTVTYSSTSQPARTGVSVLSSSTWSGYGLYTVGEVKNNTTGNVEWVRVVVTYYDASGRVTNADYTYVLLDVLGPDQKGPFKIYADNRPYSSYAFSVQYWPTSDPPAANVPVLNSSTWSEYGSLYIVGEVQNNTGSNIQYVEVIATFYDSLGQVTNVDWGFTMLRVLSTGKKACFKGSPENRPYSSYNLAVDFWTTTDSPPNLQVLSVTPSGDLHLAGEIRNNDSTKTYNSVGAVGTLYDGTGKVLNCEYGYTSPPDLGPGSTAPYDIYFWSHTTGWTSYAVDATGYFLPPPPPPTPTPPPPPPP
jgi:hypothetical protein